MVIRLRSGNDQFRRVERHETLLWRNPVRFPLLMNMDMTVKLVGTRIAIIFTALLLLLFFSSPPLLLSSSPLLLLFVPLINRPTTNRTHGTYFFSARGGIKASRPKTAAEEGLREVFGRRPADVRN